MYGIQLIELLDVLKVNSVRNATGVSPRSLIITGEDFRSVERVLINGTPAPTFIVYSPTQLVAEVPEVHRDANITDVAVMSSKLTFTQRSLVSFTFGTRPKKVSGVLRLMQTFLRILLRTPGSNLFHRRSGGGLPTGTGKNITKSTAADIQVAVSTTQSYLIGIQTPERNIAPSERLLSAEITNLDVDKFNTSISVTIVLTSHSGRRTAATLTT